MKYQPYPQYKDSGVEWLGEIPEGWDTLRIGFFYFRAKETDRADMQLLSVYRDYGVIPKDSRDDNFNNASEDLSTYQVVREGDLVINKMKAWQGSLGISTHEGIVSPAYFVLRPFVEYAEDFYKQFFHYLLRSQVYFAEYEKRSKGIRINQWDLPYEEFKTIAVILPSKSTQRAIAAFLDAETSRIDGLVKDYEELIELLKEKRQALISHAVTRGLSELVSPDDPEFGEWAKPVTFKDSGVEWIGEIPEGWEVKKLKYLFMNLDSQRIPLSAEERDGLAQIYPYYGASGIIDYIDRYIFDDTLLLVGEDGANLLNRSTPLAFLAKGKYWVNNHAHILKPCNGNIRYWEFALESYDYTLLITGSAQPKLTADRLNNIELPLPPLTIQNAIASLLERETAKIDTLVSESESAIELLKEHRSALITNAVTGKINVEAYAG